MQSLTLVLSLTLLARQALAGGVATIDNTKEANILKKAAVHVPNGGYYITNVGDNDMALRNDNKGGRSLYPTTNSATPISIEKIDSTTTLIEGEAQKCLSAQWTGKEDGLGVLYACVFGKGSKNQWGLRPAKQQWLLIPASVGGSVSSSKAKTTPSKPAAAKDAVAKPKKITTSTRKQSTSTKKHSTSTKRHSTSSKRHTTSTKRHTTSTKHHSSSKHHATTYSKRSSSHKPTSAAKKTPVKAAAAAAAASPSSRSQPEQKLAIQDDASASSLKSCPVVKQKTSSKLQLAKREAALVDEAREISALLERRSGSTYGPYYICTLDHLTDMKTRCLTNRKGDAAGSSTASGTQLVEWVKGDKDQLWSFKRA